MNKIVLLFVLFGLSFANCKKDDVIDNTSKIVGNYIGTFETDILFGTPYTEENNVAQITKIDNENVHVKITSNQGVKVSEFDAKMEGGTKFFNDEVTVSLVFTTDCNATFDEGTKRVTIELNSTSVDYTFVGSK